MAEHKNFWGDEKYEITSVCDHSYAHLVTGQTRQANKSPLYFLVQKFFLSQIGSFEPQLLVWTRFVSIAAALLICVLFFMVMRVHMGLLWAALAVVSLAGQHLFYHFAAESRPYMMWLLLFTWQVMATVGMCLQSYAKSRLQDRISFFLAALAITLVISFGAIQSAMAIMTCLFCWYFIHERPKNLNPLIYFAVPIGVVCVFVQGYYTLQGVQAFWPNVMESEWDVLNQIKQGSMELLKMPPRLLWPKPDRDAYLGVYFANIFVIAGMLIPFFWWQKRKALAAKDSFVFVLSIVTSVQVATTLIIALLVAFLHYWFVQRLFLYLIICHAILVPLGVYFLLRFNRKILNFFMTGAVAAVFVLSVNAHWQSYAHYRKMQPQSCEVLEGRLDTAWQDLDGKWQKLGDIRGAFERKDGKREGPWKIVTPRDRPNNSPKHYAYAYQYLDYIVERNQHLKKCRWAPDAATKTVSLCDVLTGEAVRDEQSGILKWRRPVYFK